MKNVANNKGSRIMSEQVAVFFVLGLITSLAFGGISAWIGAQKDSAGAGFILGLLLGPIGILITALAIDQRQKCPACGDRINTAAAKCRSCGSRLRWGIGYNDSMEPELIDQDNSKFHDPRYPQKHPFAESWEESVREFKERS